MNTENSNNLDNNVEPIIESTIINEEQPVLQDEQLVIKKEIPSELSLAIEKLEVAKEFVKYIANDDLYKKNFEFPVTEIVDGQPITKMVVNESSIINCIMIGNALGFTPYESITLGPGKLNSNGYMAVMKGKDLGISNMSALQNISPIPNGNGGMTYHIGTHIINYVLSKNHVHKEILKNFHPVTYYTNNVGDKLYDVEDEYGKFNEKYFIVTNNGDAVKANLALGKVPCIAKYTNNKITTIRFTRKSTDESFIISYSLQDATDAELYRGYHSELTDDKGKAIYIKGKPNWNNNPMVMLLNRVITIGGNIIASDILQGVDNNDDIRIIE